MFLLEFYGRCTGDVRDMFEQHIPLLKSSVHGRFKRFTGYVGGFYDCLALKKSYMRKIGEMFFSINIFCIFVAQF